MQIKTVLFDLDGTLLPMDMEGFTKIYFKGLATKMAPFGYEPEKFIKSIWAGIKAMVTNDGTKTNEQAFWEVFCGIHGNGAVDHKPAFEDFYTNEFNLAKTACQPTEDAKKVIGLLKEKGIPCVLATNPLFPSIATENRIKWAGLKTDDFKLFTTYENSHYCKPNPEYYVEIIEKLGLDPKECLMVGNDVTEDMVAEVLGMKVFLLTDCIINKENKNIDQYPHGGFPELLAYLNENC